MALFPGWHAPDFAMTLSGKPTSFRAWRDGLWCIFVTNPLGFSTDGHRQAVSASRQYPFRLLAPVVSHPLIERAGAFFSDQAILNGFPLVCDPEGEILTRWQGVETEFASGEPALDEEMAYIVDPTGVIRRTVTFLPGTQQDFDSIVRIFTTLLDSPLHGSLEISLAA